MATTYTGSLYYAMEVERSDVEAGSRHEALIGWGNTVGPACGLGAVLCVPAGGSADVLMLGVVGAICLGVIATAGWRMVRQKPLVLTELGVRAILGYGDEGDSGSAGRMGGGGPISC
jgi:hypothetical protein